MVDPVGNQRERRLFEQADGSVQAPRRKNYFCSFAFRAAHKSLGDEKIAECSKVQFPKESA